MSQIYLKPKNPKHEVFAGFDRPLQTFFICVLHKQDEDDHEDLPAIEFKAKWSRGEVLDKIDHYAVDDDRTKLIKKAIGLDEDPEPYFKAIGLSMRKFD